VFTFALLARRCSRSGGAVDSPAITPVCFFQGCFNGSVSYGKVPGSLSLYLASHAINQCLIPGAGFLLFLQPGRHVPLGHRNEAIDFLTQQSHEGAWRRERASDRARRPEKLPEWFGRAPHRPKAALCRSSSLAWPAAKFLVALRLVSVLSCFSYRQPKTAKPASQTRAPSNSLSALRKVSCLKTGSLGNHGWL